jgi:hypothetical protein
MDDLRVYTRELETTIRRADSISNRAGTPCGLTFRSQRLPSTGSKTGNSRRTGCPALDLQAAAAHPGREIIGRESVDNASGPALGAKGKSFSRNTL